jgi:anthranilate phosphoribosyltransferase
MNEVGSNTHSLLPLLKKISTNHASVTSDEIADTITHVSQNRCSAVQTGALLTAMHYTGLDARADVIAGAAKAMRNVGRKIDGLCLQSHETKGGYRGGLVDIVGTGGDGHDTFNVSTTAAIIAAGCGIRICVYTSLSSSFKNPS